MTALVRAHERMDYKRCQWKWYSKWRLGLVPKRRKFGALDLGTWVHDALAAWYLQGTRRNGEPADHLATIAELSIHTAMRADAPAEQLDTAEELAMLGEEMLRGYTRFYGKDESIDVAAVEIPLEFTIAGAVHRLKPDLVYRVERGQYKLMEHKTATTIRTEHLVIDDQARPYGSMAERALINAGVLSKGDRITGITYNFLRKALPDERPTNEKGQYLNKNGTVSKKQPSPNFKRHPVTLTATAKRVSLLRIEREVSEIVAISDALRGGAIHPDSLHKTPDKGCPKFCDYFNICTAHEDGVDITEMRRNLFTRQNPYLYDDNNNAEPTGFGVG